MQAERQALTEKANMQSNIVHRISNLELELAVEGGADNWGEVVTR